MHDMPRADPIFTPQPTFFNDVFMGYFCIRGMPRADYPGTPIIPFYLKQYLFGILFSSNTKKTHTEQSILKPC